MRAGGEIGENFLLVKVSGCMVQYYAYLSTTYPHSKVDLFVPLWVFLIPNNLSLFLMAGKADSAVGINVILVHCSNVEYTLDLLKVTSVHLW